MRLPEQKLWDSMRNALAGKVHMERMENAVGSGRPDVDVLAAGVYTPVELKAVDYWPKSDRGAVLGESRGLRRSQRNWHLTWCMWGGRSLLVVGVGRGSTREVFAFGGADADHLNGFNTPQFRAAALGRGWTEIYELLIERKRK